MGIFKLLNSKQHTAGKSPAQAKQAQMQQAIQDWTFETIKATELHYKKSLNRG